MAFRDHVAVCRETIGLSQLIHRLLNPSVRTVERIRNEYCSVFGIRMTRSSLRVDARTRRKTSNIPERLSILHRFRIRISRNAAGGVCHAALWTIRKCGAPGNPQSV